MSSLDDAFRSAVEGHARNHRRLSSVNADEFPEGALPDITLPEYEKAELRRIIAAFENDHSHHALAYLSNGLWAAAERKREKGRCHCEMPHGFGTCRLCGKPVYENR